MGLFRRKRAIIVVAASGYFDPIHVGHLEYLKLARALGDKLVVIVNNDYQTRLKKGKEFMKAHDRLKIVAALACVDQAYLSIDTDSSVCISLRTLAPHIFAKGGDRFVYEIPERDVCDEMGIRLIDNLGAKIRSSSKLIAGAA